MDIGGIVARIPYTSRVAFEIQRPRDWQMFQGMCVPLFRAELRDENANEYGRVGQKQRGIDILAKRNGNPDHFVGVQCRRIQDPLTKAEILKDCRDALTIKAGLKEIIFATTADDDVGATDAAVEVEKELRAEGHELSVTVYGWQALQKIIAQHDRAWIAFNPILVAAVDTLSVSIITAARADIGTTAVMTTGATFSGSVSAGDAGTSLNAEDPALHGRIDALRDIFKPGGKPRVAEEGLLAILASEPLEAKPWARYRIEANLGSIAIETGREKEGIARFEAAHKLRPNDPQALANLALVRLLQGNFQESIDCARRALEGDKPALHAVNYLLQATSQTNWQGDPESLVPPNAVGTEHADLGIAEFLRRRQTPDWKQRCIEISRRHPKDVVFQRVGALAVLSTIAETAAFPAGGASSIESADIQAAANNMKAWADYCLSIDYEHPADMSACLNNAVTILRAVNRHAEARAILERGRVKLPDDSGLRRQCALYLITDGRLDDAVNLLADDQDGENRVFAAELLGRKDPQRALAQVRAVPVDGLSPRLVLLRWNLMGELGLLTQSSDAVLEAVTALRAKNPTDVLASLFEIRLAKQGGADEEAIRGRLRGLAGTLTPDTDAFSRFLVAEQMRDCDLAEEAAAVLERHIDLSRYSPGGALLLQCLAIARRDEAFRKVLASAAPELCDNPEILWMTAAHAWNVRDRATAMQAVEKLIERKPDSLAARLLKIEIFVAENQTDQVLREIEYPIEELPVGRPNDRFRVVQLLSAFGQPERAASIAYRIFLERRDDSRAWMALSGAILREGMSVASDPTRWEAAAVGPNVAIDLTYDGGERQFFVIEPESELRKLDQDSWEPEHPLVQAINGLAAGARFTAPDGREASVTKLRHKYVARLHFVLEQFQARFPTVDGFRRVAFDPTKPEGLDEFIAELKGHHDWIAQETEQYRNGPWPLGILAHRIGSDVIDVAGGLAAQGVSLKVADGNALERSAAAIAIVQNEQKGCVLDLLAFWTAWGMKSLDAISATCGVIHLPQTIIDHLRARRERLRGSGKDGLKSVRFEDGKIAVNEVAPEILSQWCSDIADAIAWAEANAKIVPVLVRDDLPSTLRHFIQVTETDVFHATVVALQEKLLLVSDDMPTRQLFREWSGRDCAWSQQVITIALRRGHIDFATFTRWSARLLEAGHSYVGVSAKTLVQGLRLDATEGEAPGPLFKVLTRAIGGARANPESHLSQCLDFLRIIWRDPTAVGYRERATGLLLARLVSQRNQDYLQILAALLYEVRSWGELASYVSDWIRGHFLVPTASKL